MRFVVTSSIVLVVFWFNAAAAQEGYLGQDHDEWHRSFYQMLLRPDTKTPCCNLTDCRPTSGKRVHDHYEVKVTHKHNTRRHHETHGGAPPYAPLPGE